MKEGWEYKKLDDICSSIEDGDWIESKDQSPNGIRLIQTGNIGNGSYKDKKDNAKYISEETFKRLHCTEIFEGDILVSRLPDPVGRACTLPDLGCRCITAVDCSILKIKKDLVCNAWITYFMQSQAYFTIINSQCTGSTRLRITRKKLAEILIPVPPLSEQQSIVDYLDSAFAKIDAMKANAEKALGEAKALFQASLKEMLEPKEGWEEKTLPEISENLDSIRKPVTKNKRTAGVYPYYGASGIVDYVDDYLFDENLLCISEDGANLLMRTYPIAFPISGKVWVNNHAHVLRFKSMTTQNYVEYYFSGLKLDEYITGAAQPKLTQKALNSIIINMPISLEDQQSIVETLDSLKSKVDRLQANYDKISQECDALKQAILRQVFE